MCTNLTPDDCAALWMLQELANAAVSACHLGLLCDHGNHRNYPEENNAGAEFTGIWVLWIIQTLTAAVKGRQTAWQQHHLHSLIIDFYTAQCKTCCTNSSLITQNVLSSFFFFKKYWTQNTESSFASDSWQQYSRDKQHLQSAGYISECDVRRKTLQVLCLQMLSTHNVLLEMTPIF